MQNLVLTKIIIPLAGAILLLLWAILNTNAQGMPRLNAQEMAKQQSEKMKTELQLSDNQSVKVDSINLYYAKQMDQNFQQKGAPSPDMMAKMEALNTEKDQAFKGVLSEEQFKKYKKMRNKTRPQGPPPGGGRMNKERKE